MGLENGGRGAAALVAQDRPGHPHGPPFPTPRAPIRSHTTSHAPVFLLGAHDGKTHDPTYPLYQAGACGAAFEGYEPSLERFEANLAPFAPRVKAIKEYARPDTFTAKLAGAGVTPANLDVLKIDIDGFDLGLARAALDAGYRPKATGEWRVVVGRRSVGGGRAESGGQLAAGEEGDGWRGGGWRPRPSFALPLTTTQSSQHIPTPYISSIVRQVVLMEINSDYPPPFIFEVQYNPGWGLFWRQGGEGGGVGVSSG